MHSITRFWRSAAGWYIGLGLLLIFVSSTRAGGPQIGQIKTVSGAAVIVRDGARLAAKVGDPVFERDMIETGADATIGITSLTTP